MLPSPQSRSSNEPFKGYAECPEVPEHLLLHWDCFLECLESSPGGGIRTGDVAAYCDFYGIASGDVRDEVLRMVRLLSGEYLGFMQVKEKRRRELEAKVKAAQDRKGTRIPRPRRGGRSARG